MIKNKYIHMFIFQLFFKLIDTQFAIIQHSKTMFYQILGNSIINEYQVEICLHI